MHKFSDKAIRSKNLKDMNEAEKALTLMEVERATEALKGRYRGEAFTLKAISALLQKEAERIHESERTKSAPSAPVRFGEAQNNLFDEGDTN